VRLDLLQSAADMADHLIMVILQIKAAAMLAAAEVVILVIAMAVPETLILEHLVKVTQVAETPTANIIQVVAEAQANPGVILAQHTLQSVAPESLAT
jgi:hypothetical protein